MLLQPPVCPEWSPGVYPQGALTRSSHNTVGLQWRCPRDRAVLSTSPGPPAMLHTREYGVSAWGLPRTRAQGNPKGISCLPNTRICKKNFGGASASPETKQAPLWYGVKPQACSCRIGLQCNARVLASKTTTNNAAWSVGGFVNFKEFCHTVRVPIRGMSRNLWGPAGK
jgi:hypothetical protein